MSTFIIVVLTILQLLAVILSPAPAAAAITQFGWAGTWLSWSDSLWVSQGNGDYYNIVTIPSHMPDTAYFKFRVNFGAGLQWRGDGGAINKSQTSAEGAPDFDIPATSNNNIEITLTDSGNYYLYCDDDGADGLVYVGSGRVRTDGRQYNASVVEAYKEWPRASLLERDDRNGEAQDTFYVYWDTTYLYIGYEGFDAANQDFFVAIDVNGESQGRDIGDDWDGGYHFLPFKADFLLTVEDNTYRAMRNFIDTSGVWNDPGDGNIKGGAIGASIDTFSEVRVRWSNMGGIPKVLNIVAWQKWNAARNVSHSWPTQNVASYTAVGDSFTHYYSWSNPNGIHTIVNPVTDSAVRRGGVRINEISWNPAVSAEGYIEIHNPRSYPIDVSKFTLVDLATNDSFAFASGTVINPREFVLVHPAPGANYTDSRGIRHFYASTSWDLSGAGAANDSGAIELYKSSVLHDSQLIDFVTWSNNGSIATASWDDTAVRAGSWTSGSAIDVVSGTANRDRPIIRVNDGHDSDGTATNEWKQIGADSAALAGLSNASGGGPTSITSVAFKDSDFSTDRSYYIPGETIFLLVTATNTSTTDTESTVVEIDGGGNLDVIAYENGVNSSSFRGILRAFLNTSSNAVYSPAEDSIGLPSNGGITARSKNDPSKTDAATLDTYPYLVYSTYSHKNKELFLYFTRPIDTSTIDTGKFSIQNTSSGGGIQSLSGAAVKNGIDSNGFTLVLTSAQRNAIATWEDSTLFVAISLGAGSGTSTLSLQTIDSTAARGLDSYVTGYDTAVKINEVYPQGDTTADSAYIELFFKNDVELGWIDLRDFYFAERADTRDFYVNASINMGPGDYVLLYRDSGPNDIDMTAAVSDTGVYYSGTKFFTYTDFNQVALYNNRVTQDSSTIIDFVTWRRSNYTGQMNMPETNHAIQAAIWTHRDSVAYSDTADYSASQKSIQLINNGEDSNVSTNWHEATYTRNKSNRANEPPSVNAVDIIQVLGPAEFAPGDTFRIRIKFTDVNGADSVIRFDFRIANGSDTVWYYATTGQTPTAVQGASYVDTIFFDTSYTGNDIFCTWTLGLKWNFVDATNYVIGARASDNYPETGAWTDSTVQHVYDNDLVLSGTLVGAGESTKNNGQVSDSGWFQSNQSITWSGLTIYFQNTTVSPRTEFCTFAITDDDSSQTTQTGSATLSHAKTCDTTSDQKESVAITLIDVPSPGSFDVTTRKYSDLFRLDDTAPEVLIMDETYVFKADTYFRSPALKIEFHTLDTRSLLDTFQVQVGGTWVDAWTTDVDSFSRVWRLPEIAYAKLDTSAINSVAVRAYDQAGWATTKYIQIKYEPVNVNGNINDWQGDEKMQVDSSENIWFMLAWDDTNMYFAYQPKDIATTNNGDFFVYLDMGNVNTGNNTTINWGGVGTHALPTDTGAKWDNAFCIENNGFIEFQQDTGSGWAISETPLVTIASYIGWSGNPVTEVRMPWNRLTNGNGKPDTFNVVAFQQYEAASNIWTSYPTANPGAGADADLTFFYQFLSTDDTISPNSIIRGLINVDGGIADWPDTSLLPAWSGGATTRRYNIIWDDAFMYFAFQRGGAFPNSATDYDVVQVYIDTTPETNDDGTDTSNSWNGAHSLPFKAQWSFLLSINHNGTGGTYTNLRKWTGAAWTGDQTWSGASQYSTNNGIAEFSIARSDLGDTTPKPINRFRFVIYTINGGDANGLIWASAPTGNRGGNAPMLLRTYIQYDSMEIGLINPGHNQWTRAAVGLPAGDTKAGPFTPYIDGTKDPAWGDTPDANSVYGAWPYDTSLGAVSDGHKFPSGRADSIWITNDIANLYIGWHAHGDHYSDANNNTSHYGFIFFTDSYPAGTAYDPWKTSSKNTRVYDHSADVWVMGFAGYGLDNFSGMNLYKDNRGVWDTGATLVTGTDFKISVANAWGELKVPLSTLNVKPGDTVGIIYFARHESGKDGISDITPHQPLAISNWSDNTANITATSCKVYKIQYSSNANVVHKPSTEPVTGKGKMRSPLTPTGVDPTTVTVSASPVSIYKNIYAFYTKNDWSTYDTVTLSSSYTSGTDEYLLGVIPANFSRQDTIEYYFKIDETVDNFVYGNDTNSYVTSAENTARTNAYSFVVVNAVPTKPDSADLTPKIPVDGSTLTVTAAGSTDKDNDTITYVFQWYRNGLLLSELTSVDTTSPYTSTVSADSTSLGDIWHCDVSAGDGIDTSAIRTSNAVSLNAFTVWSGAAPFEANTAAIVDTEWIWLDKASDQRTLAASSAHFDLREVRIELDTDYVHFLIYLAQLTNANYPNIAITFDTDLQSGSGNSILGDESVTNFGDSYELPAAFFESLAVIHTYTLDAPMLEVLKNGVWTETTSGVSIDTASALVSGRIPRSWLGLPAAGTMRCAIAAFKNRLGKASAINSTVEFPTSDALDAVSIPQLNGNASSVNDKNKTFDAYTEDIDDGDIDFWFQIRYDTFAGPLRNQKPAKAQNPNPADASSVSSLRPAFAWSMTSDTDSNDTVTSYLLEIGTSSNLEGSVEYRVNVDGKDTGYTLPTDLLSDSYYWRVRARDRSGVLSDSTIWSFSITTPTIGVSKPLDVNNPNNLGQYQDKESADDTLYFQWAPATHSKSWVIKNYAIEISEKTSFDTVIVADTLVGTAAQGCTTNYTIPASYRLDRGKTYYARIKAGDTAATQNWSPYSAVSDGILYSMRTVDGDSTDWAGTLGVSRNNEAFVSSTREGGWRDWLGDTRADNAANKNYLDLDEFRVASDSYNLYFYIRFNQWNDGSPYIQIALDVSQNSVNRVFQGRGVFAEDDYVNSTVSREYILLCRAGNDDVRAVNSVFTTQGYGRYRESSADRSIELCIPLSYIGGLKEYTSDSINITAAIWWNNNGSIGQFGTNNSNVVDAITYQTFTWNEVSDNVIDYWLAVGFDTESQVNGIKIETATHTPPPTNPDPGTSYYGAMRDYIIYNIWVDRFWDGYSANKPDDPDMTGGDFQGMMDQSQYFNDLGINAFQLSPIYDYGWGSWGYNQNDLYRVQKSYVKNNWVPYMGWDEYVEMVKHFQRRNITMGIDWIPGQIYGDANSGGTIQQNPLMWFGERFGGRRILQYVADPRQLFVDHTRFMYAVGTKLFRCDNPKFYPDPYEQGLPFFAYWNEQVKTFAPDLYSYGEVPDAPNVIGAFVNDGQRMTGCLDFNTGYTLKSWANDNDGGNEYDEWGNCKNCSSSSDFKNAWEGNHSSYNGSVLPVMVNYYENHDHNRAYHSLSDWMDWSGSVGDMQTIMMWEAAGPGNPCVFYGDERVMVGKKDTTYPGWQYTTSTGKFGNTRAFPWTYDGATGDIQATVSFALKARQVFPGLRYDQASIYWLENGAGKPLSFRRGSGSGEEVIVLINPKNSSYTFNGVNTSAATTWYKDWFTDGEVQSDASANFNFSVAANYGAFLKRNRYGEATLNVTVRNNAGRLQKALVHIDKLAAYTKETNASGQCTINDIVTAKSGATQRQLRIWYPGYKMYDVAWNFSDGTTYTFDINLDTHGSSGVDITPPAAPAGLTGVARDGGCVLDWADNTEVDIESYYVYRSLNPNDANPTKIMEVLRSTYWDNNLDQNSGLTNGVTYYYKLKARDYNGNVSGFGPEIAVKPGKVTVVIRVDMSNSGFSNIQTVYIQGNSYSLGRFDFNSGWQNSDIEPLVAMTHIGNNIWEKAVEVDPGMNFNYLFTVNYNGGSSWYDEFGFWNSYGFENGRGYTAPLAAGETVALSHVWMTGGDAAPQAPSGLTAVGQNLSVKLGWSLNLENDVDRYEMWRSLDNVTFNVIANVNKDIINYTDVGLTNGTTYYYKMKAADVAGNFSGFSATVQTKPTADPDTVAPSKPSGLTANNAGSNSIVIKWSYNTEGDLAGYNVYRGTSPSFSINAANKLNVAIIPTSFKPEWIDSTAQVGTQYYYAVTAVDDFKNESDSSTPLGAKLARVNFQVDMGNIATNGNVKLTANDNFVGSSGKQMTDSGAYVWTYTTDFIVGSALQYKYVTDTLEIKFSTTSGNRELTIPDASEHTQVDDWQEYPDAVTGLAGTPDSGAAWLFWTANTTDQDLDGYNVYKQEAAGGFSKMNSTVVSGKTNYKVTGLTNGTVYSFAVRAIDSGVLTLESPNSNIVNITPKGYVNVDFRN